MIYYSINIETTGLIPSQHQILEFAAVVDIDPLIEVEKLPTFHFVCCEDQIYGDPFALAMNADILKDLQALGSNRRTFASYQRQFETFQASLGLEDSKIIVAGKNFGSFDLQFIKNYWTTEFHHRTLDIGSMYAHPDDRVPPSLADCLKRAGLENSVKHRALNDARDVVRLVRAFFKAKLLNRSI